MGWGLAVGGCARCRSTGGLGTGNSEISPLGIPFCDVDRRTSNVRATRLSYGM
ncbi:hypothetical protein ARZXY2_468 [Arthrobacter sp. ZXY-2]|nr:hypothetical protein ARZXY2_468 [Arthrobacter sp. ZXY-2]